MSWGRSAKGGRVERTHFLPSISNGPLLWLHTGEITTDGCTQLHTHYVPAPSLLAFDSPNVGSDEGMLFGSNWDESPLEEDGLQDLIACDKHKHTAAMFCQVCMLHSHMSNPLHRIDCTTLKKMGLHVQLGHKPATTSDPHTAATFTLLEHFHLLSFESKVLAYEFYHSLARRNNNAGLLQIRDRYSAFMRMVHEWRHLRQLRRAGRGHDPAGAKATTAVSSGSIGRMVRRCLDGVEDGWGGSGRDECRVEQISILSEQMDQGRIRYMTPGKNIPQGWQDELLSVRWKYALFIVINANFQLKHKAVSSDNRDPSLNSGWAYFVKEVAYKSYLADQAGAKQDHSTCVSHNAVNMADTKSSHGLAPTGVGAVDCARHDMKLANGVRDLQKGDKYINMDYLVFSALLAFTVTMINISYDIAYSEAPERGWSNINQVATSTKEMGPGSCRDTLDNHFRDWNWKKVMALGIGRTLLRKITDTIKWKKEHREGLAELERTIQPMLILQWRKEVEAWDEDNSQPNPFKSHYASITQAAVHLQLTELEAHKLQAGMNISLHTNISPSRLITTDIDLQDQQ
ncbi:uncharacterized protein EDB91DRAFT_1080974 [Suillus paluster]|uniref:uncharacterized protein n=1 Tax=Suillus paluster TaxID=48578 RepID=UPI001B85B430|nr:uncharacterized protein EDB91DRAFT_1080974 [Suillus paluster]KAG1743569.1 hypothetical protein EDB91DRAFT_1080974 [Suillus paluster]